MTTAMVLSTLLVTPASGGVVRCTMAATHGAVTCTTIALMSAAAATIRASDSQCDAYVINDYLSLPC